MTTNIYPGCCGGSVEVSGKHEFKKIPGRKNGSHINVGTGAPTIGGKDLKQIMFFDFEADDGKGESIHHVGTDPEFVMPYRAIVTEVPQL